jgi:hypothetical protein
MRFDRRNDPSPLPAELAVSRGNLLVNGPAGLLLIAACGIAYVLFDRHVLVAGVLVFLGGFVGAWLWWSYFIPQWRSWAHARGADPEELQELGVEAKLVWPRGSVFERTEIRRSGRPGN